MRFSFPIATVAFALAASAAPTAEVAEVITDLPARFGLTTSTAEPRANGLRLRVSANGSMLDLPINADRWPAVDASFLGGRGRIALDVTVHTNPLGSTPPRPAPPNLGDWNVAFLPGASVLQIVTEQFQEVLDSWGPEWHPTVGTWVQDAKGTLRLQDAKGVVKQNGFKLCGEGTATYLIRWVEGAAAGCAEVRFQVVPL